MKGNTFEYEGELSLGEQEGGFADPIIHLHNAGWLGRGAIREARHPRSLAGVLEEMGIEEGLDEGVRVRLSIEILDASKQEAAQRAREESVRRYLAKKD